MKKILIFVDSLNAGGVTKVLLDLLENINREKYDITVMTLYNQGVYIDEVRKHVKYKYCFNIPDVNNNSLKAKLYRKYWEGMLRLPESFMYKWFVKEKYDIEIAFIHGWSTKFISGSNNKKSKKIAWVHADLVTWDKVDGVFKNLEHHKKAYSKFDEVICVSQIVKEGIEKKYNVKNAKVLYNPINREKILKLSNEKIDDINHSNKFKLISVGRLSKEKGYDRLLRVVKKLVNEQIGCELLIIGSGKEYDKLNSYIKNNNLEYNIKIVGYKENPYKYVKSSDLFVCSSLSEGYSLVIAESLVLGIPVVSTKCSGPIEILRNGENGLLVENSEEGLYKGIKEIINSGELYMNYKNKAVEEGTKFGVDNFIKSLEEILDN